MDNPIVVFDLPSDRGGRHEFSTYAEAILWTQQQTSAWQSALQRALSGHMSAAIYAPSEALAGIGRSLEDTRSSPASRPKTVILNGRNIVIIQSPVGQAVHAVAAKIGTVGAEAAMYIAGISPQEFAWTNAEALAGIAMYSHELADYRAEEDSSLLSRTQGAHEALLARITEAHRSMAALEGQVSAISTEAVEAVSQAQIMSAAKQSEIALKLNNLLSQTTSHQKSLEVKISSTASKADGLYNSIDELNKLHTSELALLTTKGSSEIAAWVKAQKEQTRLEAPVELWNSRANDHLKSANKRIKAISVTAVVGMLLTIVVAIGSFEGAKALFIGATTDQFSALGPAAASAAAKKVAIRAATAALSPPTLRPTFHFELIFAGAATLLWLTMYIWAVRVLVRLYTTEHHLSIDASGRAAMVQTYLGLIKENAANEADRPIVLGAIFRPVSDGMVSDDGPPQMSLPAIIATLVGGKSGGAAG